MSDAGAAPSPRGRAGRIAPTAESALVRKLLIGVAVAFLGLFLLLPLGVVFTEALRQGVGRYLATFEDPDAQAAIRLTLTVAAIAVPLNAVFGVAASWAVAKFEFRGKSLLVTLIDLPFSVSPVVSGLVYVLLFGAQGLLGPWLAAHGLQVIFAVPGIVLATIFVTFPFVGPRTDPAHAGAGDGGRGGGPDAGCERPSHVPHRHAAQHPLGPSVRGPSVQRPRHG